MKKLTLSLLLSSALLGSNLTIADMMDGYQALNRGEGEQAYALFLKEAPKNPQAAFILGMMNYEGIGTERDLQETERWLLQAIKEGSREALYNLGHLRLAKELPTRAQDTSGLDLLLQASQQNVEQATIRLWIELIEGDQENQFFTSDVVKAIYQQLAVDFSSSGDAFAAFILGVYWAEADKFGVDEINYQKAVEFLEKSYQSGFLPAATGLAALYDRGGYGIAQDAEKATKYEEVIFNNFEIFNAVDAVLPTILNLYSVMTPAEQQKMISQLEKEAKKGSIPAILQSIQRYETGDGVSQNLAKVGEYIQQLEKMDSPEGLFALGSIFAKKDDSRAAPFMEKAAMRDYIPAIQWLSNPSNHPWNIENSVLAKYEMQGANLGDPQSIHAVIERLEEERERSGWWNDTSRPTALIEQEIYEWATKLLKFAPEDAKTYLLLSTLYARGDGVEADPEASFELMEKAYEYAPENEEVLIRLARMLQLGFGTSVNLDAAATYYLKAKLLNPTMTAIEGLIALNKMTVGFKGNQVLQSEILGVSLDEYSNQNQYFSILDHLLDELEGKIQENGNESTYGYLIADRYFSDYFHLQETIKKQPDRALELSEKSDELREKANEYYGNSYHNSEQAKLHYAEALIVLQNDAQNPEKADRLTDEARRALRDIDSLMREPNEENINPLNLNEREQVRAIKIIMQLLDDSTEFQDWFGNGVLRYNAFAVTALTKMVEEKGDQAPAFAIFYLGKQALKENPEKGYEQIAIAGNHDYLPAINYLGHAYYEEQESLLQHLGGSKFDAIDWYEKGAALNNQQSIYALAELYLNNAIGLDLPAIEADLKAITYYEQLEDPDYHFAKYHLKEAKERVAKYQEIQKGLQAKKPEAFYEQSEVYRYGRYGEPKNIEKANEYLIKAADLGWLQAMKDYYEQYNSDKTISGEILERFNRYHIAYVALSKSDWETQRLADRYFVGDRITQSRQKAREYYELALKNDPNSSASYDIAHMNRFDQNLPLAERGNAEAMLVVGRAYDTGSGVKADPLKAYEWLEKSAIAGNSDAAFYFGVSAQEGVITEDGEVIIAPDWETALKWYEKASSRFKNAISGRVEIYETIYVPAQNGDAKAMMALGNRYADDYRSRQNAYDLKMATSWYEQSLNAGELTAHFGLMKLLPKDQQGTYLQELVNNAGDVSFKAQLSQAIVKQDSEFLTAEHLQIAVDNLVNVIKNSQNSADDRLMAITQLLDLYQQRYRLQDNRVVDAPGLQENTALALSYSSGFPSIKRLVANIYDSEKEVEKALQLWQEAAEEGDYASILRMYQHYSPGYSDKITRAVLTKLESLYEQYLALAPEFPVGPYAYSEFIKEHDVDGLLQDSSRAEISQTLAKYWSENGYDFMADIERAKKWYQHALEFEVSEETIHHLQKIVAKQYENQPQNLQYLAELYLYGAIYGDIESMDYPFEQLTDLQKMVLKQQVIAYQDERDYGRDKWVILEQKANSDAGDALAAISLGDNYRYGRYVRQSIEKAIEYYELAGHRGEASAYNRLGNLFRKGEDENVEPDYPRAVAYFEKGAALGDSNTAHLAGDMLYFGEGGLTKDYAKAAEYYGMTDLSQGNHHALAKFKQAEIIYQGLIAEPTLEDYQKAFDLLLVAMEYGDKHALEAFGTWDFTMLSKENEDGENRKDEIQEIESKE